MNITLSADEKLIRKAREYANTAISKLNQKEEVVLRQLHLLEQLEIVYQSPSMMQGTARFIQKNSTRDNSIQGSASKIPLSHEC